MIALPLGCIATRSARAMDVSVIATGVTTNWSNVYQPLLEFMDRAFGPMMAIVGAIGAIYCVFLGVKFSKAEDPQEHDKAKKAIINAVVGFITLFVLLGAAHAVLPIIDKWIYTNMNVGR